MKFTLEEWKIRELINYLIDYYHLLDKDKDRTRRQLIVNLLLELTATYRHQMKELIAVFDEAEKNEEFL